MSAVNTQGPVGPPPDWRVPERVVVIATLHRSGSNFLADLMTQTDKLGRPAEYFNPNVLAEDYPGRGLTAEDSCRLMVERGTSSNGVVGLKVFPNEYETLLKQVRFSEWFGRPKWIRLKRADVLAQAISYVAAMQQRSFKSFVPTQGELSYDPEWAANMVTTFYQRYALWDAYFARIGTEPLDVVYEDLQGDPLASIERIAAFVGVDVTGVQLQPDRRFKVQRTEANAAFRSRLIEEYADPDVFRQEARMLKFRQRWRRALQVLKTGV